MQVLLALYISASSVMILMSRQIKHIMQDDTYDAIKFLLAHVGDRAHLLMQANATVFHVARVLSSIGDLSTFSNITDKVVPNLFLAFATMPWISQISYVGIHGGMLFSYYNDEYQARTMFSNVSDSSNYSAAHKWYSQSVDRDTGKVYGDAIPFAPRRNDSQWFQDALHGRSGNASWGVGWNKDRDQMLFFTAPVAKSGVTSIGIAMKDLTDDVSRVNLRGGHLYVGTEDGHVIAETGPPHTRYVLGNNTVSIHVMDQSDTFPVEKHENFSCQLDDLEGMGSDPSHTKSLDIWGKRYKFGCAHLDVSGIRMVYVIAFPCKEVIPIIQKMMDVVLSLLSLMIIGVIVGSFVVLQLLNRSLIQEAFLRASLIKQKEAIQQAERKSMNKSLAFASASHDVRTSLAGITGLVELCRLDATPNSKLDRHLEQMNTCASQLLGIVNSVLDTSKVEAGKMQLEEIEFDMAQVLEESVDIFHVVALKKGLEVIWDPCDCSVLKCSNVKGDCRRLKQILDNLLGNAVKFTSEGHVVVRAWAKKPSLENFKLPSKHEIRFRSILSHLSRCLWKDEDHYANMDILNPIQRDLDSIEFIFEVDDTGKGIPKEKRASVFENYVQVKEQTTRGHEGTGLGLGIVESYVRLMGGEISIKEKEPGEKGTCFRFNIFLKSSDTSLDSEENINSPLHPRNMSVIDPQLAKKNMTVQSKIRAMTFKRGLQMEGIHSLLLVQGETKEIMQRWMESLGVKVWAIDHYKLLYPSLEKIKNSLCAFAKPDSVSRGISFARTTSFNYNKEHEECSSSRYVANRNLPLTTKELLKKPSFSGPSTCILIIIDLSSGNMSEIYSMLKNFNSSIHNIQCKIVWLASSNTPAADLSSSNQEKCDLILQKPLHGSRLYDLLKLLQEFGGTSEDDQQGIQIMNTTQEPQQSSELGSSMDNKNFLSNSFGSQSSQHIYKTSGLRYGMDGDRPLSGMNILLVEDAFVLSVIAKNILLKLGATIEYAENGLDAVELVTKALQEASDKHNGATQPEGDLKHLPYDIILMDCEMPIMNGYEATRKIREEEKYYGLHIPIIALTAHATPEEARKSILAGMDFHLMKPLKINELLEAINNAYQN
uniref:histidine kinase n=2 Tax=Elaeis guineensis var. tenera TaxID=51953 RepID=A0A6J0PIJ2_ELAGV|nr:probable histidine kinase 2 [Elaeis guineensis]